MNDDFTIVPNSYKCQGCQRTGGTPLQITHTDGCPTVAKELQRRACECIGKTLRDALAGVNLQHVTSWPGTAVMADQVYLRLKSEGFIK